MELIAYEQSRLINLFYTKSRRGQLHLPAVAFELAKRYGFVGTPKSLEELTSEPMKFTHGVFNEVGIESLDIFSDGVVVSSKSNTEVLDAFIKDATEWLAAEYETECVPSQKVSKTYESNILVQSSKGLLKVLEPLNRIAETLSASLKKTTGQQAKYLDFGVTLSSDHMSMTGLKPTAFKVERKAGSDFSAGLYVSTAPLPTEHHLSLLKSLEKLA